MAKRSSFKKINKKLISKTNDNKNNISMTTTNESKLNFIDLWGPFGYPRYPRKPGPSPSKMLFLDEI